MSVDDFWQVFSSHWHRHLLETGKRKRIRAARLSENEIMTIAILFHQAQYRNFKAFYLGYVRLHLQAEFPHLVSYKRFVALMQRIGVSLFVYLHTLMGRCTGISFIDATSLRVCHSRRIERHRVFEGRAARGKISQCGQLLREPDRGPRSLLPSGEEAIRSA